eukprot:Nitzschia sp. Nitz4//scaffold130_size63480//41586//44189//NITZ4_006254-RA/size63480-snap-gene-0.100-mRNA-1//1//CDS//3329535204//846//frame0
MRQTDNGDLSGGDITDNASSVTESTYTTATTAPSTVAEASQGTEHLLTSRNNHDTQRNTATAGEEFKSRGGYIKTILEQSHTDQEPSNIALIQPSSLPDSGASGISTTHILRSTPDRVELLRASVEQSDGRGVTSTSGAASGNLPSLHADVLVGGLREQLENAHTTITDLQEKLLAMRGQQDQLTPAEVDGQEPTASSRQQKPNDGVSNEESLQDGDPERKSAGFWKRRHFWILGLALLLGSGIAAGVIVTSSSSGSNSNSNSEGDFITTPHPSAVLPQEESTNVPSMASFTTALPSPFPSSPSSVPDASPEGTTSAPSTGLLPTSSTLPPTDTPRSPVTNEITVAPATTQPQSLTEPPTQAPSTTMPASGPTPGAVTPHATTIPTAHPTRPSTTRPPETPTTYPTRHPSPSPTGNPTKPPTRAFSHRPTNRPTETPTRHPTRHPSPSPTEIPTKPPTHAPSHRPTTMRPTSRPTQAPSPSPTAHPTDHPTRDPTSSPTKLPTAQPTQSPTLSQRTVPLEINLFEKLRSFALGYSGSLTWTISDIPRSLEWFDISGEDNIISGTLPSEWADTMPDLGFFQIYYGQNVEGTIPDEWGNFQKLSKLSIGGNAITGTIPSTLGLLGSNLSSMSIYQNQLIGTLPSELGNLENLVSLLIGGNRQLEGTIPSEYANLTNLLEFTLEETSITGSLDPFCKLDYFDEVFVVAECYDNEKPNVECSCCDACCYNGGSPCYLM